MSLHCESCGAEISEFDIKCHECGHLQSSSGVQRMIGTVVLGQYEIIDVLGQGGMSVVYKGRHRLTEQEVALKLLPPEMALLAQVKSRFVEEAKALAQLDHANIVHLYNFGEENGCFVLAMQYVHGQTFERMIIDAEALDWTIACRVAVDVLRALEYAHSRGIIHRDMKPSNVLVREEDGAATVMDFGIAKMTNSTRLTATGQTMGTVRYMSPEQVRGLSVDVQTDIYSLGATLYEAIFGDTPFDGETHFEIMTKHLTELPISLRELGVDIPVQLDEAILKSLAKKPEDRFDDVRQFRKEIEAVMREHDLGWAETMRLSRGNMVADTPARASVVVRASTVPATPDTLETAVDAGAGAGGGSGGGNARPARRPTAKPFSGSAPHDTATATLGQVSSEEPALADELEPEPEPEKDAASRSKRAATAAVVHSGRGSLAWIAVVGLLLVGAVGGTLLFMQSRNGEQSAAANGATSGEHATFSEVPNRLLPPFRPRDASFAQERTFGKEQLRVMGPEDWDPERVLGMHREAHQLFADMLIRKKLADHVPIPPLSIGIVSRQVFCLDSMYEGGKAPAKCEQKEVHYRPLERTLFILNDREYFEVNLAYGNATAVCVHMKEGEMPGCMDTVLEIDVEFDKKHKGGKK